MLASRVTYMETTRQRGTLLSMGCVECFSWGPRLAYFCIEQMGNDRLEKGKHRRTRETTLFRMRDDEPRDFPQANFARW